MEGLEGNLINLSNLIKIKGTGNEFKTPKLYKFLVSYIRIIGRSFTRVNFEGLEKIPRFGPVIIVGNHTSNIDPIIKIMGNMRPIHYLAKEGHFKKEPNRTIMLSTGQIETFRDSGGTDALARAIDVLDSGLCLGLFPEGTRSRNIEAPFLQKGKTGVARIAASYPDISIIPMCIIGSRDMMAPGDNIIRIWKKISVKIDEPITFNQWIMHEDGGSMSENKILEIIDSNDEDRNEKMRFLYRKFTDQLMENLKQLGAP